MSALRSLAVLGVVLACGVLAIATFASGAAAQDGATEIDSCTVIENPGEYELVADIQTDEEDSCIVINSSDVTLHGNGHSIEGPWPVEANDTVVAGVYVKGTGQPEYENVTLGNVEVDGWKTGIRVEGGRGGSDLSVENAVVSGSDTGIRHHGASLTLASVTVENNDDGGIEAKYANVEGADVTVRENGAGLSGWAGNFQFDSSSVVDNGGNGFKVQHHSTLDLTDTTVSGNSEHGVFAMSLGFGAEVTIDGGTVSDNGGDGVVPAGQSIDIRLDGVTVENNDGLEVNGDPEDKYESYGNITASDLRVGQSATTAFEAEPIRLEPVARETLPAREDGSTAGDGLNVSGAVDGPVDLELDVETDDETVDLWRHDGDGWETVEEGLAVTDGTVEASVERNGTYAPGTDDEGSDPGNQDDRTIDSCTTITESGQYELTADIQSDEADSCIEVRSSDVVIEGNGHTVAGPAPVDANDTVVAGVYVNDSDAGDSGSGIDEYENVTLRNVEIEGWDAGIRVGERGHGGSDLTVENAVVSGSDTGIRHHGASLTLVSVTVENNDDGIYARHGGVEGTDVTVRENGAGLYGWDGGFQFDSSSVVDNGGNGATLHHHSTLNLTDTTVSGNSEHGVSAISHGGFRAQVMIDGGTVSDNGGDGVHAWGGWTDIRLDGVAIANNDGLEVNGDPEDRPDGNITASDLRVGQSATTAFEAEPIRLEPVDREALPEREGGTAAGDGLEVGGAIDGPVDLELVVETDDDTVDLWRYDGDGWETVAEDLAVSDGTIESTVERNGTYAPGTDDEPQDGSGDESGGSEDDSDGTEDDTDGSDDSQDDSDGTGDGTQDGTDGGDDSDGAAGGSDGTGDDTQDDTDGSEGTGDGTDGSDGTGDGAQDDGAGAGGGADDSGDTGESSDGGDAGAGDGSGASGDDEESGADDSGDGGQNDAGPSGDDAGASGDGGQDGSSASTSSASGTSGSSGSGGSSDSGGSADSAGSASGGTTGPSGATATPYSTDVEPSDADADGATETVTPTDTEESEYGVVQADEEDDGVETEDDDGVSLADGPGFGPLVVLLALALFAMVAVILVVQRQA